MLLALVIAIVSFAAFLRAERKTIYPLMDLNLFKKKNLLLRTAKRPFEFHSQGSGNDSPHPFLPGQRGYGPLTASILTIPLAVGLVISLVGLLGLATMHYNTPYWILVVWMFINSFGS
jgi:hypothetical protein